MAQALIWRGGFACILGGSKWFGNLVFVLVVVAVFRHEIPFDSLQTVYVLQDLVHSFTIKRKNVLEFIVIRGSEI